MFKSNWPRHFSSWMVAGGFVRLIGVSTRRIYQTCNAVQRSYKGAQQVTQSYECCHVIARWIARNRTTFAKVARLHCDLSGKTVASRLQADAKYVTVTCSLQWIVQQNRPPSNNHWSMRVHAIKQVCVLISFVTPRFSTAPL